ncbi:unnamed protein product [Lepidochelys kempii]
MHLMFLRQQRGGGASDLLYLVSMQVKVGQILSASACSSVIPRFWQILKHQGDAQLHILAVCQRENSCIGDSLYLGPAHRHQLRGCSGAEASTGEKNRGHSAPATHSGWPAPWLAADQLFWNPWGWLWISEREALRGGAERSEWQVGPQGRGWEEVEQRWSRGEAPTGKKTKVGACDPAAGTLHLKSINVTKEKSLLFVLQRVQSLYLTGPTYGRRCPWPEELTTQADETGRDEIQSEHDDG